MGFSDAMKKIGSWCSQHAPELLAAGALISGGAAIGLAVKATPKAEKDLHHAKGEIDDIRYDLKVTKEVDEKTYRASMAKAYAKEYGKVALNYIPAAICAVGSGACTLGAVGVLKKRNSALTTLVTTTASAFANYRENVIEDAGVAKDMEYMYGGNVESTEKIEAKSEDGTVTEVNILKLDCEIDDNPLWGPYTIRLDENWSVWRLYNGDISMITGWIESRRRLAENYELKANGYVYLDTVLREYLEYDEKTNPNLDMAVAHEVGWIVNPLDGDNEYPDYISCGTHDADGRLTLIRDKNDALYLTFNAMPITKYLHDHREEMFSYTGKDSRWGTYPESQQ